MSVVGKIMNRLHQDIGIRHDGNINQRIFEINGEKIIMIECIEIKDGEKLTWLTKTSKQGVKTEGLPIRTAPATKMLTGKEAAAFVANKMRNK